MKIAFVFGDAGRSGYTGGDLLAFRLANCLANHAEVTFVRLIDWRKALSALPAAAAVGGQPSEAWSRRAFEAASRVGPARRVLAALGAIPEVDGSARPSAGIRTLLVRDPTRLSEDFDHAVATGWQAAYYLDWGVTSRRKHQLVLNAEDDPIYSGKWQAFAQRAYALPLHRIALGPFLRSRFPDGRASEFQPGIDTSVYDWKTSPDKRIPHSVIMPLRAASYKGTDLGLDAATVVQRVFPGLRLTLFGNKWATRASNLRLPAYASVLNNPTGPELAAALNSHQVFLFPSRLEGFPVSPLEAMRCGCLLVATPTPGVLQFAKSEWNSLVADSIDSMSLANTLGQALTTYPARGDVMQKGYETASKFSWEASAQGFVRALEEGT